MPENAAGCEEEYAWDRERHFRESDYAYASTRVRLPKQLRHLELGYDLARHFATAIAARRRSEQQSLEQLFHEHAERWKDETGHLSSITKRFAHPSYLRIIALVRYSTGNALERLLLQELSREPDHWFDALTAVTGENPVKPTHDFDAAVAAWLEWGRKKGISDEKSDARRTSKKVAKTAPRKSRIPQSGDPSI